MNSLSIQNCYNEKITILNKIKGKDTLNNRSDLWVKRVYDKAAWSQSSTSGISGTTVVVGTKIKVILTDLSDYVPYKEFCRFGDFGKYFTISLNDYIVRGEVTENVDSSNITKILSRYEPEVLKVQSIITVPDRGFTNASMKLEGV